MTPAGEFQPVRRRGGDSGVSSGRRNAEFGATRGHARLGQNAER